MPLGSMIVQSFTVPCLLAGASIATLTHLSRAVLLTYSRPHLSTWPIEQAQVSKFTFEGSTVLGVLASYRDSVLLLLGKGMVMLKETLVSRLSVAISSLAVSNLHTFDSTVSTYYTTFSFFGIT